MAKHEAGGRFDYGDAAIDRPAPGESSTDKAVAVFEARRRLVTVLIADVDGYTRHMAFDDQGTRRSLNIHRERFGLLARRFGGRVVDTAGDSMLAEFSSVRYCVECALEFQRVAASFNTGLSAERKLEYRIGITLGDVIDDHNGIYGDAVNIAARIQSLAIPGGVCVSGTVRELVEGQVDFGFQFVRDQRLKNRSRPVRVFRLQIKPREEAQGSSACGYSVVWSGDEPAIAVLPFLNLGVDKDAQYLGDGIAEDIITELSRFGTIQVLARATSFSYRDRHDRFERLRDELNVRYALEGSLRLVGGHIRITVQLIDCDTAKPIWIDRYTHENEAGFDTQDEVVSLIVSMLERRLKTEQDAASDSGCANHRRAYDLCLRGHRLLECGSLRAFAHAGILLRKAVAAYPGFSRAYSELASMHYLRAARSPGSAAWRAEIQQALDFSRAAVERDPADGRAYTNLAWGYMLTSQFDEAEGYYVLAGELDPDDADILLARGRARSLLGDATDGIALACRALRLDPVRPRRYFEHLGEIRFFARQFEDCVEILTLNPPASLEGLALLAAALGKSGDRAAACEAALEFVRMTREAWCGGESPPGIHDCLAWLERVLPIRNAQDRLLLHDGLGVAGLYPDWVCDARVERPHRVVDAVSGQGAAQSG